MLRMETFDQKSDYTADYFLRLLPDKSYKMGRPNGIHTNFIASPTMNTKVWSAIVTGEVRK